MRPPVSLIYCFTVVVACGGASPQSASPTQPESLRHGEETHLANIVQLTYGTGENAEAYWSPDGTELIFQTTRPPYECDQIMRMPADGSAPPSLVSTGTGRTTCAYFMADGNRTVWSSTHLAGTSCPPQPDHSQGYVWALYDSYEIFASDPDGGNMVQLTNSPGYDAEATVCSKDGSIIFTSTRDGDLELYRMDADGKNVKRLTHTPGYDGGAFFSQDCSKIVWRASRPEGEDLAEYQRLLKQGLVRPSRLEIFVANADGSDVRQVTYLGAASFAPYFHPSGRRILFSTNHADPQGREFDIWAVNVDGTGLEQITHTPGFDGFPMFSPDGTRLAFSSNRNQKNPRETDVYVANWMEGSPQELTDSPAERFRAEVTWLADDAREGRGVGTKGIDEAADWLATRLQKIGAEPAWGSQYKQALEAPVHVKAAEGTKLSIASRAVPSDGFVPASFSSNGRAAGKTVFVGYGIVAKDLGIDDYRGKNVKGKIAVIRRHVPSHPAFAKDKEAERRYGDLHHKAFTAREKGAIGVIIVDAPEVPKGQEEPGETPLPPLHLARHSEVGIPVAVVKREFAQGLLSKGSRAELSIELTKVKKETFNVAGVIRAKATDRQAGVIVVGAHYDHLGLGTHNASFDPGSINNGADDNASGTAGLLEVARQLVAQKDSLRRDVYLVAFTAEELGLLGSKYFVEHLPEGLDIKDIRAMLNMDMIGRLRNNAVSVLAGGSAKEWGELVLKACAEAKVECALGNGGGYGPSDQTAFYAEGIPVLHFFTGAHPDYHRASDDAHLVNAAGGARVAQIVGNVASQVANRDGALTYQKTATPPPPGDPRSFGASLGTIPDYTVDDGKGVVLSDVRPGGPADHGGLRGKDRIVQIGKTRIRNLHDFMYVLRQATPGATTDIWVERDEKRVKLPVTFGKRGTTRSPHGSANSHHPKKQ